MHNVAQSHYFWKSSQLANNALRHHRPKRVFDDRNFVKIDRTTLNTLLRSGLKPQIKTRKQLAALLGLDPTSLTRWFASHDRLGNPRYPVVPDRHVSDILQIFDLPPDSLYLENEQFRQYCFELALQRAEDNDDAKQKALIRLENIARRKLTIPVNSGQKSHERTFTLAIVVIFAGVAWWWFYSDGLKQIEPYFADPAEKEANCWTGYSPSMGSFDGEDKADPCHYSKLFHRALEQLKTSNKKEDSAKSSKDNYLENDYILFLFTILEQRRTDQKLSLNIELGRRELRHLRYDTALAYFQVAKQIFDTSPKQNPKVLDEITAYIKAAVSGDYSNKNPRPEV
jgi:hypothetical protein